MGLFSSRDDLGGFSAEQLEEMAADDREDARFASRRGDTGRRRELSAEAAELEAEIARRQNGGR